MTFLTKRLTVMDVFPCRPIFSPKVSVREVFPIDATIFSEQKAHKLSANVMLFDKDKKPLKNMQMEEVNPGLDAYRGFMSVDKEGDYFFAINVYVDAYKTWLTIADIKISAHQDQEVVLAEGVQLLKRLKKEVTNSAVSAVGAKDAKSVPNSAGTKDSELKKSLKIIDSTIKAVGKKNLDYTDRFAHFKDEQLLAVIAKNPIKDSETPHFRSNFSISSNFSVS
jgi:hypothetical protein